MHHGKQMYWLLILFSFPLLGSIVYFVVEYLPASRMQRTAGKVASAAIGFIDPEREYRAAEPGLRPRAHGAEQAAPRQGRARPRPGRRGRRALPRCAQKGPQASDPRAAVRPRERAAGRGRSGRGRRGDAGAAKACARPATTTARTRSRCWWPAPWPLRAATTKRAQAFESTLVLYSTVEARARYVAWLAQQGDGAASQRQWDELQQVAARHWNSHVSIQRNYEPVPVVVLDRHKLLQILGNLLANARHALRDKTDGPRVLTLNLHARAPGWVVLEIRDTGVRIDPGALTRLFEFGFTTKKDGHGFGLHTSAILAKEMGGHLAGHSDGVGYGAQFAVRLPLEAVDEAPVETTGLRRSPRYAAIASPPATLVNGSCPATFPGNDSSSNRLTATISDVPPVRITRSISPCRSPAAAMTSSIRRASVSSTGCRIRLELLARERNREVELRNVQHDFGHFRQGGLACRIA